MTEAAKSNEPAQSAIDAVNLARIRKAQDENHSANGTLRSVFAQAQLQNLDTDAAKEAIRLVKKGGTALDDYFAQFKKVGEYVKLMGKELSPAQYELFGLKQGPTPEDERGAIEGRAAGFRMDDEEGAQEAANPYPGSVKGNAWLTAFRQARSERDAVLAMPKPDPASEADDTDSKSSTEQQPSTEPAGE